MGRRKKARASAPDSTPLYEAVNTLSDHHVLHESELYELRERIRQQFPTAFIIPSAEELRRLIEASGRSHADIAAIADIHEGNVSRLMRKHRNVSSETAIRIWRTLWQIVPS